MVSLSDNQLRTVMDAAASLQLDRRAVFLERVGAMLKLKGIFSDADVADVTKLALTGLARQPAA
jgi:hypothetical protein